MEDRRDLLDSLVEETERRRVREHEPGGALVHLRAQVAEVEISSRARLDLLELVARHRHAGRVGAVRRVGRDDRVARLVAVGEVRAHQHQPGELALRAGRRLQRDGRKSRDLGEDLLQLPHELERSLGPLVFLERMEVAEAGEARDPLVDPRVVLHRARAEGIEARVDTESAVGERRDVTHELGLGDLGQAGRSLSTQVGRQLGRRQAVIGYAARAAAWLRAFENQRSFRPGSPGFCHRHTSPSTSASRSMSAGVRFSVTATRRTSCIPS